MNQMLKDAIAEVEKLPDADQEAIAQQLRVLAARKEIDARLAASEARGGETPHEEFMAELKAKYGA